jgi:hypothetical protein
MRSNMLHLQWETLSPSWSEFLTKLFRDLAPLGHALSVDADGMFSAEVCDPATTTDDHFWDEAHRLCHQKELEEHRDEILRFERDFDPFFVDMATFQPSAVRPVLEIVDFKRDEHKRIVEYLRLTQSVTSRKLVGKRMGLLIWDVGQTGGTRLFGGAILASARFSQQIRDERFGWPKDYPKTSRKHDPAARVRRVEGLNRIMQLSMACAIPPYNVLSGAWLAAIAPFTAEGLEAFRKSHKTPTPETDLVAVVTTTSKGPSGAPFRGHRVKQLAPSGTTAVPDAEGDLYAQIRGEPETEIVRSSFDTALSRELRTLACELFKAEQPAKYAAARKHEESASLGFAFRRLGLQRSILEGNEIGIHLGALNGSTRPNWSTLDYIRTGITRPLNERALIDWEIAVGVWSRKFLPAPELVGEIAQSKTKAAHREARQKRNERARTFPADQIRLSHLLQR